VTPHILFSFFFLTNIRQTLGLLFNLIFPHPKDTHREGGGGVRGYDIGHPGKLKKSINETMNYKFETQTQ
jgi:hypothetical protein